MHRGEAGMEQKPSEVPAGTGNIVEQLPRDVAELLAVRFSEDIGRLVSCLGQGLDSSAGEPLPAATGGED